MKKMVAEFLRSAHAGILRFLRKVGHYLGLFWTIVILGLFYWTIFTAAALLVKLLQVDLLKTRTKPQSTWQKWETVGRSEDIYRPY